MKEYKVFTSGKMGGLTYNEQMEWRLNLENLVFGLTEKKVKFIHPPEFFDYDFPDQKTAKEWEINQIIDSDIVVIELGVIHAVNRMSGKHIATIGIGKPNTNHPWIKSGVFYRVDNVEEAAKFICKYLLI